LHHSQLHQVQSLTTSSSSSKKAGANEELVQGFVCSKVREEERKRKPSKKNQTQIPQKLKLLPFFSTKQIVFGGSDHFDRGCQVQWTRDQRSRTSSSTDGDDLAGSNAHRNQRVSHVETLLLWKQGQEGRKPECPITSTEEQSKSFRRS
jgi:hypothetical protein